MANKMSRRRPRNSSQNVKQIVKSILRSREEMKKFSLVTASSNWFTTGTMTPLSQGLEANSFVNGRDGESVNPRSLEVNFTLSSSVTPYLGRVIIFQDMLNVGVAPTVANILDGGVFDSTYALYPSTQKRFRILHDVTYSTNNTVGVTTDSGKIFKKLVMKMRGKIMYNGETNATASNGPGSVWILTISDVNTVGAYTYYSSLNYSDP